MSRGFERLLATAVGDLMANVLRVLIADFDAAATLIASQDAGKRC